MANSRDRRRLRRMLQEAGLSMPPPSPAPPQKPISTPFLKRIPGWVYLVVVAFSVVITLLEGYPWLSIQRDESFDSANPFATTFYVANEGYIPLTDLDADCNPEMPDTHLKFLSNSFIFPNFSHWLAHSDKATVPCFAAFNTFRKPPDALKETRNPGLEIRVVYAFLHINLKLLRRSQTFRFKGVVADDGLVHWIYIS
jgi:hypothetical protein